MHNYMNFILKKSDVSDISKDEYYHYNPKKSTLKKEKKASEIAYKKIECPSEHSYIVFDFETTGLSPYNDKIIEIGAIKVINDEISGEFNELVNPERVIPPFISSKINITNDMVKNKRTIDLVLPEFVDFIEDLPLIAHNAKFDAGFLICNMKNYNMVLKNPIIDTLYLSRKYFDFEKNNLIFLSKKFGIDYKNAHRALADVKALLEIYKIIQKKAEM